MRGREGGADWGRTRDGRVTQCRKVSRHSPCRSRSRFAAVALELESVKKSFAFSVSRLPFRAATPG